MEKISSLKDIDIDFIYEFIENGITGTMPQEVADYLEMMDKVRGMRLRHDKWGSKDAIVNHLIKVDGLSRYLAEKLFNQTIEYFYADDFVSKSAWRNMAAEDAQKVINLSLALIENVNDGFKVIDMIKKTLEMRQAHLPEIEELPKELFERPFKLYFMNPEDLGLPTIDRKKLTQKIDSWEDLSEAEREIIKREARVLPLKVFPSDEENPRKRG